jgi:hypothetical protein
VQKVHLSEHAAYLRIQAARLARRFPAILEALDNGSLHLSAVSVLGPHLTDETHVDLLNESRYKSKRDVELLVARVRPQPDVVSVVRKLPAPAARPVCQAPGVAASPMPAVQLPEISAPRELSRPVVIAPLAPERYKVQFTISHDTHERLRRVQDLMRHTLPSGDPAEIFDRALTLLLVDLSKTKCGATTPSHRDRSQRARSRSRHIPASVRREVWRRDEGRCAFHGEDGRCTETGFLEFHHVVPYADGGETSVGNLQLRCRTHNRYEAECWSGVCRGPQVRETRTPFRRLML